MSATFDKLKAMLAEKKALTNDEVAAAIAADGDMTDDEKMWLEAERHKLSRATATITLEEYLAASKVLDTADPSSDEYKKAEEIVNKYEAGQ
jgi:hypothetical protein